MKELIKRIVKYIIIFIGVLIILMSLLLATMKIPRSAIYGNLKQSTEYFKKRHMVYFIQRNREYTYLHLYSESALLSIIYYVDTDNVLESAMHDRYYESAFPDTNKDFIKAINNDEEANTQYLRYWHGNMVWVRPLLTLFSIQKIFWINYCIINVLFAILLFMLLKRSKKLALIYVIAMIVIAFPIVGISVLYSSMFYLMIIASMIAIKIEQKGNDNLYILFFVIGMLTCFFDFLTTELITLYVPILFVLFLRKERDKEFSFKDGITFVVKASIVWAIAYVAMWGAKWLLASIVLKRNAMEYVIDNLKLRINGVEGSISLKRMYSEVISKNFFTLYPLCNMKGRKKHFRILIVLILTFIALIDWKNIKKKKYSLLMLMIAIIPYIRFLALVNHSYKHYFFTYRSQIITVIAVSMILVDSLNYDIWFKEIGCKNKKQKKEKI